MESTWKDMPQMQRQLKDKLALTYYGTPYNKLCTRRKVIISKQIALTKSKENSITKSQPMTR